MINCNDYKSNTYSQYGEDGIIEFLLTQIDQTGFVIEFGAADGTFMSNTAKLWKDDRTHEALLIESSPYLCGKLQDLAAGYDNVTVVEAMVTNIDDFTTRVADVCSIDVDGVDYHIAERMKTRHKIVIVEYNPTVPVHVRMIGHEGEMQGSSALSITELMQGKGYTLVACTKTNLFFLDGDHSSEFESRLEVLFDHSSLNYVVTTYDGRYEMIGDFGYGLERPGNLGLVGGETDKHRWVDSDTREYIRVQRQILDLRDGWA